MYRYLNKVCRTLSFNLSYSSDLSLDLRRGNIIIVVMKGYKNVPLRINGDIELLKFSPETGLNGTTRSCIRELRQPVNILSRIPFIWNCTDTYGRVEYLNSR